MYWMQTERLGLRNRIEKKAAYLQELEEQVCLLIFICFMFLYHLSVHNCV